MIFVVAHALQFDGLHARRNGLKFPLERFVKPSLRESWCCRFPPNLMPSTCLPIWKSGAGCPWLWTDVIEQGCAGPPRWLF